MNACLGSVAVRCSAFLAQTPNARKAALSSDPVEAIRMGVGAGRETGGRAETPKLS